MNFFKSVFADEPDPPNPDSESESGSPRTQAPDPNSQSAGWNFGDLIKTIATKSETVIETYRRDLQEFGSGLKKEIEVAQGSLETVGTKIDELGTTVLQGTAQIISQNILSPDHELSDSSDSTTAQRSLSSTRYSRFESQLRAIQGDVSTYIEEPEEAEEYERWKMVFALEERRGEIEELLEGNEAMERIYGRVAPSVVDDETFWRRYYFRVYKLKQAEDVRANLVKRAISVEEDEELSWDVDDDEYEEESNVVAKSSLGKSGEDVGEVVKEKELTNDQVEESSSAAEEAIVAAKTESVSKDSAQKVVKEEGPAEELQGEASKVDNEKKELAVESSGDKELQKKVNVAKDSGVPLKSDEEKKVNVEGDSGKKELLAKSDDKAASEVKSEAPTTSKESGVSAAAVEVKSEAPATSKESDVSAAAVRPSAESEEEDLGWDEIEDLSSIDEKKPNPGTSGGVANRAELQKRLSTAEEDEDLSWDIDDDEPAKA